MSAAQKHARGVGVKAERYDDSIAETDEREAFILESLELLPAPAAPAIKLEYRPHVVASTLRSRPRLPYDLIVYVAEILADEVAGAPCQRRPYDTLATLAYLNRLSRTVHAITLPALYRRTVYMSEEDFARSVGNGGVSGWTHTKYLYLTSSTFSLLKQHFRYFRSHANASDPNADLQKTDFRPLFPRLVLLSVIREKTDPAHPGKGGLGGLQRDIYIEIYKQVLLDNLHKLCLPPPALGFNKRDAYILGLPLRSRSVNGKSAPGEHFNVAAVVIHTGGGLAPVSKRISKMKEGSEAQLEANKNFNLVFMDRCASEGVKITIDGILNVARRNRQLTREEYDSNEPIGRFTAAVQVKCSSAVLQCFTQALYLGRLPSVNLEFELRDDRTSSPKEVVFRHMKAMSEAFSRNWTYDWSRSDCDESFVKIEMSTTVDAHLKDKSGRSEDQIKIRVVGDLQPESGRGSEDDSIGFGTVAETWMEVQNGRDWENNVMEWYGVETYPCRHVPVPEDWES